ncbi:MAG: tail fiber domain-containing protein [Flammeovirgaceae bacterium]|nr:tail fiber domain-containing protein [Flammeovirgaceae bacterium]
MRRDGTYIGVLGSAPAIAGNYGVYSSGQAGGTTTWAATSDIRFKKNIIPLSNSLDTILKLRGVSYDWRRNSFQKNFKTTRDIGIIAQEIMDVIPEVVVQDKEDICLFPTKKIVPVLMKQSKKLTQKVKSLEQKGIRNF